MRGRSALVLFSGGQDSTVCLAWALQEFNHVETVCFFYGQRHHVELDCREGILNELACPALGPDHYVDIPALGHISETALTTDSAIALGADGLPNTFVPGRNIIFMTMAATIAYREDIRHLVGGMCETDFSGYPDCRNDTMMSLQTTLNLGMASKFKIHTPLMWLNKAQIWGMADNLGILDIVKDKTHTCYLGIREPHAWGHGCGDCPACRLRAEGYEVFRRTASAV